MTLPIRRERKREHGFTLVELILVIVLVGIIGGVLTMMLAPAIQSYLLVGQRAALTTVADTALRTIAVDVRRAVPNSLRLTNPQCLELVPTSDGGRYRSGPIVGRTDARYINDAEPGTAFDVLTRFTNTPAAGDVIVVGNRGDEVYTANSPSVAVVQSVTASPAAALGEHRIQLGTSLQVPPGYDGGRFVVVPAARRIVTYRCSAGIDAGGSGTGTLVRLNGNNLAAPPACGNVVPAGAQLVATKVSSCSFVVHANAGATQDSGYVQLQLTLSDKGESVPLTVGVNVSNVP
ncbi:type II secretion system protein [Massilia sp.]|uniref:type II secretion system protein n=1 Tax=Massilia sp. TaxID=1882437 RepID=UPI00289E1448|nr:type II secretion system protein [Massilia sp.]